MFYERQDIGSVLFASHQQQGFLRGVARRDAPGSLEYLDSPSIHSES